MAELTECKTVFSNGTEYMWFLENQCDLCTRFRNGRCRIYGAIELARLDDNCFPYSDLMDYKGCAGKKCKRFTTEKPKIIRHKKQIKGQIMMDIKEVRECVRSNAIDTGMDV